jgi:hypothetical protein
MKYYFFLLCSLIAANPLAAQLFSEQSAEMGINHTFNDRALMGGGAAFFDLDNDGDDDFYITSGANRDDIYRNNGDGSFSKLPGEYGLEITFQYNTMGVTTGDIDNDGDRDIFVTTWERYAGAEQPIARSLLFLNNGDETFTEIGESAGITHVAFGMGAAFLDYNKDGLLDVYVMNHIEEAIFTYDQDGAIDGMAHECYPNFLYRNNGDLTFTEVSEGLGLNSSACTIAAVPSDYDMDGDLDLYLANDFGVFLTPNELYRNNYPENSFSDVSAASGSDVQTFGMGIAAGDYDHDLDFDYYVTNIGRNVLVENDQGTFTDVTTAAGVENTTVPVDGLNTTGWGTAFLDVDNDTWDDLYVANGRIPTLAQFATSPTDPDKLYLNNGDKTFTDITDDAGVGDVSFCHGMAYSDYDQDGDLDIIVVVIDENDGFSKFYVNEIENDNHYVQFKLTGVESNRDAYGSKIWLYAGEQTFVKELYGGGASHASQHTSVMHFGLGEIEAVDSIRIDWPNGHVDHLGPFEVDTKHEITEGIVSATRDLVSLVALGLEVSPNPFEQTIRLRGDALISENIVLYLINTSGQIIERREMEWNGDFQLDVNPLLPAGMYTLIIQSNAGTSAKKLIKF